MYCEALVLFSVNNSDVFTAVGDKVLCALLDFLQSCQANEDLHACYLLLRVFKTAVSSGDSLRYQDLFSQRGGVEALVKCFSNWDQNQYRSVEGNECENASVCEAARGSDIDATQHAAGDVVEASERERPGRDGSNEPENDREIQAQDGGGSKSDSETSVLLPSDCQWCDAWLAFLCLYHVVRENTQNQNSCGEAVICLILRVVDGLGHPSYRQARDAGCHLLLAISQGHCRNMEVIAKHGGQEYVRHAKDAPFRDVITRQDISSLPDSVEELPNSVRNAWLQEYEAIAHCRSDSDQHDRCETSEEAHVEKPVCTEPADKQQHAVVEPKAPEVCYACGKTAAAQGRRRLLKCSACTIEPLYCSAECQRACWGDHRAKCLANRKAPQ
jgi:hypothetical protein